MKKEILNYKLRVNSYKLINLTWNVVISKLVERVNLLIDEKNK